MLGVLATFAGTALRYSPLWIGAVLIFVGLALIYLPMALMFAGVFLVTTYMRLTGGKRG